MNTRRPCAVVALVFMLTACRAAKTTAVAVPSPTTSAAATPSPRPTPSPTALLSPAAPLTAPPLATPVSQTPAAGICGSIEGDVVTVTIHPDIADPRCVAVAPHQQLRVINKRKVEVQVRVAGLEATLAGGAAHLFTVPLGVLLAPGVHRVEVRPCCGAELWLKE